MNANFMKNVPREAFPNAAEMNTDDSVPWYMRYGARVIATIGGVLSVILGIMGLFSTTIRFFGAGIAGAIVEILGGGVVLLIEAPFLCAFLSFAQKPGELLEKNKSPFVKAILLIVIGLLPNLIAPGLDTIFGSGLVLLAGVFYAVIGFGRKAPREQMAAAATGQSPSTMEQGRPPVY